MDTKQKKIFGCGFCVVFITSIVLFACSMFTKLNSVSGFNSGNIMKHVYVDTLKDKHSKVPLYVDYKKVPMMVQADGNTKRIQDLNGGPVPGV